MGKRFAILVLAWGVSVGLTAQAQTIYRTTDEQGNVVFTDDPAGGGEEVRLEPLTVVPAPDSATLAAPARDGEGAASPSRDSPFMPYDRFSIVSPDNEATLPTGAAGNVQVQLGIRPALRDDHQVRLLLDGQISQSAMHTDTFMLSGLERGEHTLQAELLDASGAVRHRSAPVTLYVQRASVYLPQNPNNPGN